jgi:hypothetical protein
MHELYVHKRIKFGWLMRGLIAFGFHLIGETVFWLKLSTTQIFNKTILT